MPKRRASRLPLTRYPNAAAAYSTRLLNSAYTGAALRVRRAADNVEVDVPFAANPALGTADMEGFLRSYTGGFGTNLLLYSEEFDNGYWSKTNATVSANSIASPIDTLTAETYTNTIDNNYGSFNRTVAAASATYTLSLYVKANTVSNCGLELRGGGQNTTVDVAFSLIGAGSVLAVDNEGGATASIQSVGNGWYRVTLTKSVTNPIVIISAAATLTGDQAVGASIYVWGAQLELGSTATTYDYKRDTANTSAFVTTWYDQSGNARNATQTTAANQPRIVNAGVVDKVNGRGSVKFDNLLFLRNSALTLTNPTTSTFSVAVKDALGAAEFQNTRVVSLTGAGTDSGEGGQLPTYFSQGNTFSASPPDVGGYSGAAPRAFSKYVYGQLSQFSSLFTASSHTHYRNGAVGTVVNAANPLNSTAIALGVTQTSATTQGTDGYLNGNISEIILYPSDQSANRAAIESNIMSYFGITA